MAEERDTEPKLRVNHAMEELLAAEKALAELLETLRSGVRAEKMQITTAVEDAFTRLRVARSELASVRELIDGDD